MILINILSCVQRRPAVTDFVIIVFGICNQWEPQLKLMFKTRFNAGLPLNKRYSDFALHSINYNSKSCLTLESCVDNFEVFTSFIPASIYRTTLYVRMPKNNYISLATKLQENMTLLFTRGLNIAEIA